MKNAVEAFLALPEASRRLGPFRLRAQLGRGGFAPVWLADEEHGGMLLRTAAVKLFALEDGRRGPIVDEARALCRVEHPHVVRFYALPTDEARGIIGLAMEYVDGTPLDRRLVGPEQTRLPMDITETLAIGVAIASALSVVHEAGLVHRDVKPANVIDAHGVPKLIDFGIAAAERTRAKRTAPSGQARQRLVGDLLIESIGTQASDVFDPTSLDPVSGTMGYIDPICLATTEQATDVSDLYGLGAMLFELLTGYVPAVASAKVHGTFGLDPEVLYGQREAVRVSEIRHDAPAELDEVIAKLLSPMREHRYRTAAETARALGRLQSKLAGRSRRLPPEGIGPFRGLRCFDEADRDVYFGRSGEIAATLELLRTRAMVTLLGASGSGKSSLARAGVAPLVADGALGEGLKRYRTVLMTPGPRPWSELMRVLTDCLSVPLPAADGPTESFIEALSLQISEKGDGILLIVDQLEELVTQATAVERGRMVELLTRLGERVRPGLRVLCAARRDFLEALLSLHEDFARVMTRGGTLLVGPMTDAGWAEVLDQALDVYQVRWEDEALRSEVLADLCGTGSAMPLVQFALEELWTRRDVARRILTRSGYEAIGGIRGALEQHAEQTVAKLLSANTADLNEDAVERILLSLTTPQGTRALRREVDLVREHGEPLRKVIAALEAARLVVREDDSLALAHDVLIVRWSRLSRRIAEGSTDRAIAEQLEQAAADWSKEHDNSLLLRGRRLASASEVATRGLARLSPLATRFVGAAITARFRLRAIVALGVVLVLAGGSSTSVSYVRKLRLERDRTAAAYASAETMRAQAEVAASFANAGQQASRAMMMVRAGQERRALALALVAAAPFEQTGKFPPGVVDALVAAVTLVASASFQGHTKGVRNGDISPDGSLIVTASWDHTARVWSAKDGKLFGALEGHTSTVTQAIFSPDGKTIATSSVDGTVRLFLPLSGKTKFVFRGHTLRVNAIAFSPDGRMLATAGEDKITYVVDATTGKELHRFVHDGTVNSVAVWGSFIATGCNDKIARVYDSRTGTLLHSLPHPGQVWTVRFSSDGRSLLTAGDEHRPRVFRLAERVDGKVKQLDLPAHSLDVEDVVFSPDDKRVASVGDDRTIWITDLDHIDHAQSVLDAHANPIFSVAFSPDGKTLLTGAEDKRGRLWDLTGAKPTMKPQELIGHTSRITFVGYDRSGEHILTTSFDHTPRLWDKDGRLVAALTGELVGRPRKTQIDQMGDAPDIESQAIAQFVAHDGRVTRLCWNAAGTELWSSSFDKTVRRWDVKTGRELARHDFASAVNDVAVSADGQLAVAATDEGRFPFLLHDGKAMALGTITPHTLPINTIDLSLDRRFVITGGDDGLVIVRSIADPNKPTLSFTVTRDGEQQPISVVRWLSWRNEPALLIATKSGILQLLRAETGTKIVEFVGGHKTNINAIAIRNVTKPSAASYINPTRFATTGDDGLVKLWSLDGARREAVTSAEAHGGWVHDLTFSPDGTHLVSASIDELARLWDGESLTSEWSIAFTGPATAVAYDPSGSNIAIGGENGLLRVLPSSPKSYLPLACKLLAGRPEATLVDAVCRAR